MTKCPIFLLADSGNPHSGQRRPRQALPAFLTDHISFSKLSGSRTLHRWNRAVCLMSSLSWREGPLSCFHFSSIVSRAGGVCFNVQNCFVDMNTLISLRQNSKSGIAGPFAKCMFNYIRKCQIVFQNDCTISYADQLPGSVQLL